MGNFFGLLSQCWTRDNRLENELDLVSNINEDKAIGSILASVIGNLAGIPL